MDEPKEFFGQWWLPAGAERRISGTFEFHDRFMELSLEAPLLPHGSNVQDEIPVIHGISRGERLTLITCRTFQFLQPFVVFQVRDAVLGVHIGATHLSFAQATVAIDGLTDWMPAGGLKTSRHTLKAKAGEVAIDVSYTAQRPLTGRLADGTHVQLDTFPQSNWGIQRFSIAIGASVRFRPKSRKAAAVLASEYVSPVQELVSWATQQPALVTAAYLKPSIKGQAFKWLRAWRRSPL